MKVSMNSWHFRLQSWFELHPEKRRDLCSYMRGILFSVLGGMVIVGIFGGFIPFGVYLYFWKHWNFGIPLMLWGSLGYISLTFIILRDALEGKIHVRRPKISWHWPSWEWWRRLNAWLNKPVCTLPKLNFEDNLTIQWLKAKKHRICPLIQFTWGDEPA